MRNRNEAPATILANTEVFDYLKEKVGERKTRTEAYCDLLDKSLAGFVSPFLRKQDYDLGPCQCHVTVSDLASEWHWHRATVRSFLDTLEAFGQLERIRLAKSVIITMHLRIGTPDMPDSGQKETDFATRIQGILYDWVIGKATSFDVGKSCGQIMRQTLEITGQDSRAYPDNHSGTTSVHTLRSEEQLRETVLGVSPMPPYGGSAQVEIRRRLTARAVLPVRSRWGMGGVHRSLERACRACYRRKAGWNGFRYGRRDGTPRIAS